MLQKPKLSSISKKDYSRICAGQWDFFVTEAKQKVSSLDV